MRKWAPRLALLAVSLLLCEAALQCGFRLIRHYWLFGMEPGSPEGMFVSHPYLVMTPKRGAVRRNGSITISHSASGWRGPDLLNPKRRKRIVVLGGSSTYCTGVDDADTFPAQLQRQLGDNYEVINLGVPGYSSVEHLIQTALWFSEIQPDIAIYYMGWNDARNMHLRGLKADYSDFQGPSQLDNLGQQRSWWAQHFALVRLGVTVTRLVRDAILRTPAYQKRYPNVPIAPTETAWTPRVEDRPLQLYRRNVNELVHLCKGQGVTPLFVPQLVNPAALTHETSYGWLPFVRDKDLPALVDAYNRAMLDVAQADGVSVVTEVRPEAFQPGDFLDYGHFSPSGTRKMAVILEKQIRNLH